MQLDASFFRKNRQKLIALLPKKGVVIIAGNGRMQRTADNPYPFRQDSNLYYLSGIEEPCVTLVIDTLHNQEWLMMPFRSGVHAIFDGEIDKNTLTQKSGITDIISEAEGLQRLKQLDSHTSVFMPKAPPAKVADMYTNPYRAAVARKLKRLFNEVIDIRFQIAELRAIKTSQELTILASAAKITIQATEQIAKQLDTFKTEAEIEAEIGYIFRKKGATGHAFSPIVASGSNSCTLHYVANNSHLNGGLVLLDIGAELHNYSADISRTLLTKNHTSRQKEVVQEVKRAQMTIIRQLAVGMSWQQLAELADNEVGKSLVNLGLIKTDFTRADVRTYFPHAVSHFLGLDTHDVGDYTMSLKTGMVITVEPGIYIQDESFGVRFEDDIVLTKSGPKILGQ